MQNMLHQRGATTGSTTNVTYASIQVPAAKKPRQDLVEFSAPPVATLKVIEEESGRERLKRHRSEMAGRVWIPDVWGQESFLKEWVDSTAFDSAMVPNGVVSAREALVQDCRRANSPRLRIRNRF